MAHAADRSLTSPLFEQSARDLLEKLQKRTDPESLRLRADAEHLIETFKGWRHTKPDDNVRAEVINRLIDLNRRVLIYLSKVTRG